MKQVGTSTIVKKKKKQIWEGEDTNGGPWWGSDSDHMIKFDRMREF